MTDVRDPDALEQRIEARRERAARSPAGRTAIGCSSSRPTPPSRPNTCCCGTISASRSMPSSKRKIAVYLRRIQGAHGGWPLFHDGDFDMSASVKAYFALKMIGDSIDADHMRRAREAIRARGGAARAQRVHPHHAGAVRLHVLARGAGDAGRDHAAAEVVSLPPRQDLLLEPHRHRAAAGADGAQAARAQSQGRAHRRIVPRLAAEQVRLAAEGAAAEMVLVPVLPRRRRRAARRRAAVSTKRCASARSIARSPSSPSGSTARTGSARSSRRWPTA